MSFGLVFGGGLPGSKGKKDRKQEIHLAQVELGKRPGAAALRTLGIRSTVIRAPFGSLSVLGFFFYFDHGFRYFRYTL